MHLHFSAPIILFDIDGTLFDVKAWAQASVKATLEVMSAISAAEFENIRQDYKATLDKSTDYDPKDFLAFLEERVGGDSAAMEAAYLNPQHFAHGLYPEAISVLTALKPRFAVGLFSEGVLYYQKNKIDYSGISSFFEDKLTYILHRKTKPESLQQLPPESYIVDNSLSVIEDLLRDGRFHPIWLNRDEHPHADAPMGVPIIRSLKELPAVLAALTTPTTQQ